MELAGHRKTKLTTRNGLHPLTLFHNALSKAHTVQSRFGPPIRALSLLDLLEQWTFDLRIGSNIQNDLREKVGRRVNG